MFQHLVIPFQRIGDGGSAEHVKPSPSPPCTPCLGDPRSANPRTLHLVFEEILVCSGDQRPVWGGGRVEAVWDIRVSRAWTCEDPGLVWDECLGWNERGE